MGLGQDCIRLSAGSKEDTSDQAAEPARLRFHTQAMACRLEEKTETVGSI
jgi:hypothetical protein